MLVLKIPVLYDTTLCDRPRNTFSNDRVGGMSDLFPSRGIRDSCVVFSGNIDEVFNIVYN